MIRVRWPWRRPSTPDNFRGPLHPRGGLRDWILFATLALAPATLVGALGLRAIANEEASARRELALSLAATAQGASRRIEQAMAEGERALAAARLAPDAQQIEATLREIAPPFAEHVLLGPDRALLLPPPLARTPRPAPAECRPLADAIAMARSEPARADARRDLLARCVDARSEGGRYLWPVVALDALTRGELGGDAVADWLEERAAWLSEAEREASRLEVQGAGAMSSAARERALAALTGARSQRGELVNELSSGGASAAIGRAPDASGLVIWRADASAGTLRALSDGSLGGFVVHRGSLAVALTRASLGLPADLRAEIHVGGRGAMTGPWTKGEALGAMIEITPGLGIWLSPQDPAFVAREAARRRAILGATGIFATTLAFALAALLFARMRAAKRSSELRMDFVSTVSHELRTPIASVRMLAELLEEGRTPPEEQQELFDALGREARRLSETVERLLGFGKMAAKRYVIERAPMRVADAVAASVDAFEEQRPDEARVVRALDEEACADIDPAQIRLAVDNLLANARKYAPEGRPYRVTVQRDRRDVLIAVSDHGPGVAKRDRERIFEPFERADDRLSRATEGSGIGLSLVRHVARAHGGRAYVESELNKGATFILRIPAREQRS